MLRQVVKHDAEQKTSGATNLGRLTALPTRPRDPLGTIPYSRLRTRTHHRASPRHGPREGVRPLTMFPGRPSPQPPCLAGWAPHLHGLHGRPRRGWAGQAQKKTSQLALQARVPARGTSCRSRSRATVEDVGTRYPSPIGDLALAHHGSIYPCGKKTKVGKRARVTGRHWRGREGEGNVPVARDACLRACV